MARFASENNSFNSFTVRKVIPNLNRQRPSYHIETTQMMLQQFYERSKHNRFTGSTVLCSAYTDLIYGNNGS